LVPVNAEEEICEVIEQPHLSWADDEPVFTAKKSTVKKVPPKPVIVPEPEVEEIPARVSKKRSSRLKKSETVEGKARVTRSTRSRSKTRAEDTAPLGHKPIKLDKGKQSKRSKSNTFPMLLPENPKFMVSSMSDSDKTKIAEMVNQLGGTISTESWFDPQCVGLITESLIRSEKVLCSIASGKFILKTEYLHRSVEAGKFLPVCYQVIIN